MSVDQLQDAEQDVAQMREEEVRRERAARREELERPPLADTASKSHTVVEVELRLIRTMVNMRVGQLPELHELALSIRETGLLHPPLVRATGDELKPYELLAGRRRFAALGLLDEVDGPQEWRFTLVEGISRREALTMQFAENFHQSKPEPVQFARAARAIMAEDETLTAADVSRLVGAPAEWTRKALRLLELPEELLARVERGDLSFTVADLVRRGIAGGKVSAEEADALVEQHAAGEITGGALKLGVGYVPPKPKDYEEQSRKLDESRWAAKRGSPGDDAADREWAADRNPEGRRGGSNGDSRTEGGGAAGAGGHPNGAGGGGRRPGPVEPEELDAYLLGLALDKLASAGRRRALGVESRADAHRYAFSLQPHERLGVLRLLADELLAGDAEPPAALR